ncbi:MAG: prohibitin family protein [Ktedonobacteraceae bacterium]|nr:prohibitin family protein [Ktedonobacteraceae bacterium]
MSEFLKGRKLLLIPLVILGAILFLPGIGIWTVVDAGHVGVVTRFGAVSRVVNPGLVFKLPLFEGVYAMETRTQKEQIDTVAASKDLQAFTSTIALNYHLQGEKAVEVYQNIGVDYSDRIIAPALQEAFKSTTTQFTSNDLISQREKVKQLTYENLKNRLTKYDIIVDDFNIVNFAFSQAFRDSIEQKTVAEQNREKAEIDAQTKAIQAKSDADTATTKAEADAKATVDQAKSQAEAQKALKDSGNLSDQYLRFLTIQKWDGKLPSATSGTPFVQLPGDKQN